MSLCENESVRAPILVSSRRACVPLQVAITRKHEVGARIEVGTFTVMKFCGILGNNVETFSQSLSC